MRQTGAHTDSSQQQSHFLYLRRVFVGCSTSQSFQKCNFHIWRFPWSAWKAKWSADVEELLCPQDGKLRSFTILRRASEAPELRYLICALTVNWQHAENRITGRNIRGFKVNPPFTFTTLFVWEKSLPKVSRAKKHRSNFHTAQVQKKSQCQSFACNFRRLKQQIH